MKEKIYYFGNEAYHIDKKDKLLFLSLSDTQKEVLTFKEADTYIKRYKNMNRIHKPVWLLFYTDFKNNNLKDWSYKEVENNAVFKDILMRWKDDSKKNKH